MSVIADLPDLRPSLLLDFANSRRVDPRIQCTRASTATCFGPDGKLRTVAANVPRIDFDPATGKCLGLLVEEARTNIFPRSKTWAEGTRGSGATWSEGAIEEFPGGVSLTAIGLYGSAYSFSGGAFYKTNIPVLPSTTYVLSVTARLKPGGSTDQIRLRLSEVGGVNNYKSTTLKEGHLTRCSITLTTSSSAGVELSFSIGTEVGLMNVELVACQLEAGAFPTSYIPTEATAVTRAADIIRLESIDLSKEWTVLSEQVMAGFPPFATLFSVDSPSIPSNLRVTATSAGNNRPEYTEGGTSTNITWLNFATGAVLERHAALACNGSSLRWALNGVASADTAVATKNQGSPNLRIGLPANSGNAFSGWTSRIAIYSAMLSAAHISRLTA